MKNPQLLGESELDRIIKTIPSSRDRLALMTHLSISKAWNLSEAGVPQMVPEEEVEDLVRKEVRNIVNWINKTWPTHTVRAKMAQKVAGLIKEGAYRG